MGPTDPVSGAVAGKALAGMRVLLVDDDLDTLETLGMILQLAGADVTTADSAAAALECVHAAQPDVIVSDLNMPHVDGLTLLGQLRAATARLHVHLPAVALTAASSDATRYAAGKVGFDVYLVKPAEPAVLVAAVRDVVARARA